MSIRVNPLIDKMTAYTPGEQPQGPGFIKLNTNENPYPPAPAVLEAVRAATEDCSFQKYPDSMCVKLRTAVAETLGVGIDEVFAGNGSDEVLRLLCQVFLDPAHGDTIGALDPTYSLYATLAGMFGVPMRTYPTVGPDHVFPGEAFSAPVKLFFLANPNPPLGTFYDDATIDRLAAADPARLIVVDEAYVAFAPASALEAYRRHENVVITRTFSKSYSLAGLRVGLAIARPGLIAQLVKAKDSYNLNMVSQLAAEVAWRAADHHDTRCAEIVANREHLAAELRRRKFEVPESAGNFVFARGHNGEQLYLALKREKILVRWFGAPSLRDGMRITVGTCEEIDALLAAIDRLL